MLRTPGHQNLSSPIFTGDRKLLCFELPISFRRKSILRSLLAKALEN